MECSKAFARLLLAIVLLTAAAQAPALTTEMQKAVRAGTFEVVLRKNESDALKYEKPLPLELIPFVIRSDAYWSVGIAFALSSDTYVSAAHVFATVVNSQFGAPALRDSAGHVYPVDRILKWSSDEDYVVFSISGAPPAQPLPASTERKIDDAVFAVGNALGEGIVMRATDC
jgi:serine protease Do